MIRLGPDATTREILSRWRAIGVDPTGLRPLRVGIVASYTTEPILPALGCFFADRGLYATFVTAPFNQIYQTLLDPASVIRSTALDLTLVLPRLEDLCGPALRARSTLILENIENATAACYGELEHLLSVLATYERTAKGPVLCANFAQPRSTPLGVLDATHVASESQLRRELNVRLWRALLSTRVITLDVAERVAQFGTENAYDDRMWHLARHPYSAAFGKQLAWLIARTATPLFVAPAKVIVVDLDNTLWGGVVGEDGIGGILLGDSGVGSAFVAFQEALLEYRNQGVLICVASKNNQSDAFEVFEKHSAMVIRREHLAAFRINWNRKSDSLIELARELRLGLDSMVFVDDSPTECDEVRRLLPEVTVLEMPEDPAHAVVALRSLPELDRVVLTSEDRVRADQYRVENQRAEFAAEATGDPTKLEAYLLSLALKVEVRTPNPDERSRVAQLTQKTNQFNLTTIRRTEAEIDAVMADPAWRVFVLTATDRFGDYGLVGVCIAEVGERFRLDTFLLSCRVLGRGVETAFLAAVARRLSEMGCDALEASFIETPKNAPARPFLAAHGFALTPQGDWLRSPLDPHAISAPHIELAVATSEGGA